MKTTQFGVQELSQEEMKKVDGGFIPLVILGIKISAEIVAATFLTGMTIGAGIAISESM